MFRFGGVETMTKLFGSLLIVLLLSPLSLLAEEGPFVRAYFQYERGNIIRGLSGKQYRIYSNHIRKPGGRRAADDPQNLVSEARESFKKGDIVAITFRREQPAQSFQPSRLVVMKVEITWRAEDGDSGGADFEHQPLSDLNVL